MYIFSFDVRLYIYKNKIMLAARRNIRDTLFCDRLLPRQLFLEVKDGQIFLNFDT